MGWLSLAAVTVSVLAGLATADTCASVAALSNIESVQRLEPFYTAEQTEYWSTACSALEPSCILYPSTADEVAAILAILSENDERFAVKSGGHNPNDYFASIASGPLISTARLDSIVLDPASGRVRVGPGARWDAVAAELDGSGWTVVGGRIGNVGVGGLLLGGGLSYLSQAHGWAMSSILEMDVALANGTVITACASHHADLFRALKGGGNNFGVVTSFLLQGYRQSGPVFGGNLHFARSEETDAGLLAAVRDFTEYNVDDKAAIIVTAGRAASGSVDIWVLFIFYDGPEPPAGTFDNFTSLGPFANTLKKQSYSMLLTGNNIFVLQGSVYTIGTETVPLPRGPAGLADIHAHWRNASSSTLGLAGATATIGYQPFPRRMARAARARGVDLVDADDAVDRIIVEFNYSHLLRTDSPRIDVVMKETIEGVRDLVLQGQDADAFLALFMNDGYYSQDYFGRLRPEARRLAKRVAADVDPEGLFQYRTGGFKL
ncbi:hypothetical protein B0J13DRAFT_156901 [Dactylonectria estremocensis]|uniref:FAD-binding PCMH-type domain-containing protein n=1 Tax=Dactylonectria estremocensis TaxID=1079267 RepID=A0A9P9IK31_9HYPO|nr:hypothetical protein B0J13DRAFT_156901 [Dactylonectria estremocensis]